MDAISQPTWRERFADDLSRLEPVISKLGFKLDDEQPHLSGERFLMTRNKLVLTGQSNNDQKVIIKAAKQNDGKEEINKEKKARDMLVHLAFASEVILFPKELYFGEKNNYLLLITEYIPQNKVFVSHTLEEQFFMILRAFEAQESFHATTFEHLKTIENIFPIKHAREYFESFRSFIKTVKEANHDTIVEEMLEKTLVFLETNKRTIDKYCNYLVHTDFVPHNFRVHSGKLYMLDVAAVEFGNKYEGWARFLNYMTIHNRELESLLSEYILRNRGEEDYLNLRLMRAYKIGYLIEYYIRSLQKTSGDLHELTKKRIVFWHRVLESILDNTPLNGEIVDEYKGDRDNLRSKEEKERQKEFAIA